MAVSSFLFQTFCTVRLIIGKGGRAYQIQLVSQGLLHKRIIQHDCYYKWPSSRE